MAVAAVGLPACAVSDDDAQPSAATAESALGTTHEIRSGDNGKTITVAEGDTVRVQLRANAGDCKWFVRTDRTLGRPTETLEDVTGWDYYSSVFTWEISEPGAVLSDVGLHGVRFEYRRANDDAPVETFEFTLDVVAASD